MKKILFLVLVGVIPGIFSMTQAQKVALKSGSLSSLNGVSELKVEYTYDDMMVGKMKEADYVTKKVKEYNDKEAGKGDAWKETWENDRASRFQPWFEEAFNGICGLSGFILKANPYSTSKYRMVVHTTFTEPGFNIYMTRKDASINMEVKFYDEAGTEIALVTIMNSPGGGIWEADFDTGVRIQDAYANAGRSLAAKVLDEAYGK
jgi:hypothetical protein